MVKLINIKFVISLFLFSLLFSQEMIINSIEITGLITASEKQIFRNTGLYACEKFIDDNLNNLYDQGELYTDENKNGKYDYGTKIYKGDEFNSAINNLWKLKVFSDIQISVLESSSDSFINLLIELEELPIINIIRKLL